tara:strand:+ start:436 stop:744 length:309 start_codon:yes stop_codon:yes gene_type:complete
MSAVSFDNLQFSLKEIVEILEEIIFCYEHSGNPSDIEYDVPNIMSMINNIDDQFIDEIKILADRTQRDFLWVDLLDKYLSGEISREMYSAQLDVIRFDNLKE